MDGFGDPPEYLANTDGQVGAGEGAAPVELAQVEVGAFRVLEIPPHERDDDEALVAVGPVVVEFRLESDGETGVLLARIEGVAGEKAAFKSYLPGDLGGVQRQAGGQRESQGGGEREKADVG